MLKVRTKELNYEQLQLVGWLLTYDENLDHGKVHYVDVLSRMTLIEKVVLFVSVIKESLKLKRSLKYHERGGLGINIIQCRLSEDVWERSNHFYIATHYTSYNPFTDEEAVEEYE